MVSVAGLSLTRAAESTPELAVKSVAASEQPAAESAVHTAAADQTPVAAVRPRIDQRFAANTDEVPDFRRHVLPMFGRLGCNGRACHGSFQGQGGFRLSLFGYDFKADHDAICQGKEPRVNPADPAASLIIQKPSKQVDHEGGRRFAVDSWQYRVLLSWLQAGAKSIAADGPEFGRLEVLPREVVFAKAGETRQMTVIAHWADGSSEDVTPICRYRTNDDSICKVDENGLIVSLEKGDTHVVAFYDNGVQPISVLLPVSDAVGPKYPQVATPTKVDELVVNKLRKLGIIPADLADDAEFLRRVTLDITGTLPTTAALEAFLADSSSDKRAKQIDLLLERPAYAAWWTTKLCDITGNSSANLQNSQQYVQDGAAPAMQWYSWMNKRVKENMPYDQIVAGIVLAVSREPGQDYEQYCEKATSLVHDNGDEFAKRETMPYYWARKSVRKPDDMALGFAYAFLGVRMQCSQCHKHPFDQWTKQDFDQFANFFNRMGYGVAPDGKEKYSQLISELGLKEKKQPEQKKAVEAALAAGKSLPMQEVFVGNAAARKPLAAGKEIKVKSSGKLPSPAASAKLLGGDKIDLTELADPRQALMDWMRHDPERYFARSYVNRVWAGYFSVGIIEPTDDLNQANPPSNKELLDYLTHGFVEHHYDMKWLHREICNSRAYQSSWKSNATNRWDTRNYSRAIPRRMAAEVAYDAVVQATASDQDIDRLQQEMADRAIGPGVDVPQKGKSAKGNYVLTAFGKPIRATNCDCERSSDPSLLQTIYLRNDSELYGLIDRSSGWLRQVAPPGKPSATKQPIAPELLARQAYMRTLSRLPSDEETAKAVEYLSAAANPTSGVRDLLWALVNTKEFIVNH